MSKLDEVEDCPFTYKEGEEPPMPEHKVKGVCVHCFSKAYTFDIHGKVSCWGCAYDSAS